MEIPDFSMQTVMFKRFSVSMCPQLGQNYGLPRWQVIKNLSATAGDAGDIGSVPALQRSPGEGNGNPLQYSCLEKSVDRGAL